MKNAERITIYLPGKKEKEIIEEITRYYSTSKSGAIRIALNSWKREKLANDKLQIPLPQILNQEPDQAQAH